MSSAVHISILFLLFLLYIASSGHSVKGFYTASAVTTTTETPPEYESFLKVQTTIAPPVALPLSSDQQPTTESPPPGLNGQLSVCEDDSDSSEDKDDSRPTGEEAPEEDKRILTYVSALKDTGGSALQTQTANFSTAESGRRAMVQQLQQQAPPSEEVETEEVFPLTMIKSFRVAPFGEVNSNRIEQADGAPNYLTGGSNSKSPLKLPVFTRYSLEARPFSAFSSTPQGDNYDHQRPSFYREQFLNEIVDEVEPQIIEVLPGNFRPLEIHFKSSSRRIKLVQKPPEKGNQQREPEVTRSEEEPQRLIHTVHKPIIQELREFIYPQRRVIQEIHPVQETYHTIVSTRTNKFNSASNERSRPAVKSEALRALEPALEG